MPTDLCNYDLSFSFPPACSRADAEVQDHARSGRQTRQPDLTELTEWCIYQAWLKIWLSRQTTHFKRLLLAAPPSPPSWLLPCNPPAFSRHSPAHAMSVAFVPILVFQLSTCSSTCQCMIAPIPKFQCLASYFAKVHKKSLRLPLLCQWSDARCRDSENQIFNAAVGLWSRIFANKWWKMKKRCVVPWFYRCMDGWDGSSVMYRAP